MSSPDRRLLSIMRLFEAEKRTSLSAFFSRWAPSQDATVSDALEVVQSFDPVYMLRTCLAFPSWRRFREEKGMRDGPADDSMYDPLMVIVLSAQMLVECPPTTSLDWVKVFRSNVVSLLIRCLSSKDPNIRETALCQIASLWESVQVSYNEVDSGRWFVDSLVPFCRRNPTCTKCLKSYMCSVCLRMCWIHLRMWTTHRGGSRRFQRSSCCTRFAASFIRRISSIHVPRVSCSNALNSMCPTYQCCSACCTATQTIGRRNEDGC
jgi:hypothetical protein